MCAFQTGLPERATLDPSKRVNYSFGLVLGLSAAWSVLNRNAPF